MESSRPGAGPRAVDPQLLPGLLRSQLGDRAQRPGILRAPCPPQSTYTSVCRVQSGWPKAAHSVDTPSASLLSLRSSSVSFLFVASIEAKAVQSVAERPESLSLQGGDTTCSGLPCLDWPLALVLRGPVLHGASWGILSSPPNPRLHSSAQTQSLCAYPRQVTSPTPGQPHTGSVSCEAPPAPQPVPPPHQAVFLEDSGCCPQQDPFPTSAPLGWGWRCSGRV